MEHWVCVCLDTVCFRRLADGMIVHCKSRVCVSWDLENNLRHTLASQSSGQYECMETTHEEAR
jgi:hypothetical protein